jgi:hypothetical protein
MLESVRTALSATWRILMTTTDIITEILCVVDDER